MGEVWALAARRTNARGTPRLRLSFRTAHTAHACRVVAQATLMGRSGAHMLTPVWALVAKAMDNHDRLMQSPWGRGQPWKWGPGEDAHLLCIHFPGCLRRGTGCTRSGLEGAALNFPPPPSQRLERGWSTGGLLEGPDPGTGGAVPAALPDPTLAYPLLASLPTSPPFPSVSLLSILPPPGPSGTAEGRQGLASRDSPRSP